MQDILHKALERQDILRKHLDVKFQNSKIFYVKL